MNLGKFFAGLGKGALEVADIAHQANIPILSQIDAIADSVKDVQGKRKVDIATVDSILDDLDQLKSLASAKTAVPVAKSALESNRFKMTLIGLIVAVLVHYGLPADVANNIAEVIFYLVGTYVAADTLRGSVKFE